MAALDAGSDFVFLTRIKLIADMNHDVRLFQLYLRFTATLLGVLVFRLLNYFLSIERRRQYFEERDGSRKINRSFRSRCLEESLALFAALLGPKSLIRVRECFCNTEPPPPVVGRTRKNCIKHNKLYTVELQQREAYMKVEERWTAASVLLENFSSFVVQVFFDIYIKKRSASFWITFVSTSLSIMTMMKPFFHVIFSTIQVHVTPETRLTEKRKKRL